MNLIIIKFDKTTEGGMLERTFYKQKTVGTKETSPFCKKLTEN